MKNANRNLVLAAGAALALVMAPSAPADVRLNLNLPRPPSPREVLGHLPAPPIALVDDRDRDSRHDRDRGWNNRGYDNRDRRNDGYRNNGYRNDGYRGDQYRSGWNHSDRGRFDGRWGHRNRYSYDRYRSYGHGWYRGNGYRSRGLEVWIDGRWVMPPFPGAVWVEGYYDEYGDWVPGQWVATW